MDSLSFLRPALLLGLLGLAIPVAIHLLGRRRVRTVPFTTLRFLRRAQARATARWHLRRLLLLMSRLLIVAAFAVLFSGPGCMKPSAGKDRPTSWIYIVDNSPSMLASDGGPSALERAKRQLSELLMEARDQDRYLLVTTERAASGRWATGFSSDRAGILAALSNLDIRYGEHDIGLAIDRASGIATEVQDSRIVLATDLQSTGWQKVSLTSESPVIDLLDVGFPDARNDWISAVEQDDEELRVLIGHSPREPEWDQPQVRMEDGQGRTLTVRARSGRAGFVHETRDPVQREDIVNISLRPGGIIQVDDRTAFPASPGDHVDVLVVNGDPRGFILRDETLFLRNALSTENGVFNRIRYREIRPSEIPLALNTPADVVILANVSSLTSDSVQVLREARERGTGLVFTSGSNWSAFTTAGKTLSAEERAFQALLPLPVRARVTIPVGDPLRPPYETIDLSSLAGPFTVFSSPDFGDLSTARVRSYWVFETRADESLNILVQLRNGAPLLLEKRDGKGRSLVLATSIDRDEGNLCLQPAFLPFIHRLVLGAADRLRPTLPPLWPAGTPVSLDFPWPVTVLNPDSSRTFLDTRSGTFAPDEPGLYTFWKGDERVGAFSAIFPPEESDLTRITKTQLANYLGADRFALAHAEGGTLARQYRARDDAAPFVSAVLLCALLAEALLASRWKRKRTDVLWERPL